MKKDKTEHISGYLQEAGVLFNNIFDHHEITAAVAEYRYDEEKLGEGKQLLETTKEREAARMVKYMLFRTCGRDVKIFWSEVKKTYYHHLQLARVVLKGNNGLLDKLGARGSRKFAVAEWIKQAKVFYTNTLDSPDVLDQLDTVGLTPEKLEVGRNMVESLEAKFIEKESLKGEARHATKERDEALDQLKAYVSKLKAIIKLIFKDQKIQIALGEIIKK